MIWLSQINLKLKLQKKSLFHGKKLVIFIEEKKELVKRIIT